jgi:PIN domain
LRTNFVLIDYENVQPDITSLLNGGTYKIKVFVGAAQAKVPLELARTLQSFGPDAEYLQIEGRGSNALDSHIAYCLGQLAAEFPDASFQVISKDTGFDPLIKHLKARKILCQRSTSIVGIPLVRISTAKAVPDRVQAVIDNLIQRKSARPRTLKTLGGTIKALFGNQISDDEVQGLIDLLGQRGVVTVSHGKVTYDLPS